MTIKKVKKFEIEDNVNFIRMNGRVYSLNDVGKCSINDVLETSKSFYETQANSHTESLSDELVNLAREQEQQQLAHILKAQSSNVCTIPDNVWKKPIVAFGAGNNKFSEIRFTGFLPNKVYFGRYGLEKLRSRIRDAFHYGPDTERAIWPIQCKGTDGNGRLCGLPENVFIDTPHDAMWRDIVSDIVTSGRGHTITVLPFLPRQLLMTYFDGSHIRFIKNHVDTTNSGGPYHPHEMGGGNLCTGNIQAPVYWANTNYHKMLNEVNYESLASTNFRYIDNNNKEVPFDMYNDLRKMVLVAHLREEATTWRTRQT